MNSYQGSSTRIAILIAGKNNKNMTGFSASKRALFRRITTRNPEYLRPPWAVDEYTFVDICRDCASCIESCSESIIQLDQRNQPFINFNNGECTFCGDCVSVCKTGALSRSLIDEQPWNAKVILGKGCLSENKTLCRSCGEVCEHGAIHFPLSIEGIVSPEINSKKCNGCGACIAICPGHALNVCYSN